MRSLQGRQLPVQWIFVAAFSLISMSSAFAEGACTAVYGAGANSFSVAAGSPGEIGLLRAVGEVFSSEQDADLCWQKAGSGKALQLLKQKKVDMVIVHSPQAEKQAVKEGWAIKRKLIGSNEFYIVGPHDDPAGLAEAKNVTRAYSRIAEKKGTFFSRGDHSGTHKKETAIWKMAGIRPSGPWYIVTETFMMATLEKANERKGYFMTDSSTWVAAKARMNHLKILFRGDPFLINTYHALCQPEGATAGQAYSSRFIDFLVSERGQGIIRDYGVQEYGEGLYQDAGYAEQYDH